MKNLYDVLKQKETELQQLQKEIEALHIAARLLADDGDARAEAPMRAVAGAAAAPRPIISAEMKDSAAGPEGGRLRQFP